MNGRLLLTTVFDGEKTIADRVSFTPPYKLYSPFYTENGFAKFISMSASAGVLSGDSLQTDIAVGDNCRVIFTDQGYKKLFDTADGFSTDSVKIRVGKGACLWYCPHPIMTFSGCSHKAAVSVNVSEDSTLVFHEIYCCGRTAMGEKFALKRFHSRTEISVGGKADLIDNTLIDPEKFPVQSLGFFEGYTHTGFLYVYSKDSDILERVYDLAAVQTDSLQLAATHTPQGIAVRAAGYSGEDILSEFEQIGKNIMGA